METALRCLLVAFFAAGAAAKLAGGAQARDALATFGLRPAALRRAVWIGTAAVEAALAAGIAFGSDAACFAAGGLMTAYALAMLAAIANGRSGAPCGCLGAKSRVGWSALLRNVVVAGLAFAAPLTTAELSADSWLAAGLALALIACAFLAVALTALAREVGELRLRLGPQVALDIAGEGPARGTQLDPAALFGEIGDSERLVAVFKSDGCHLCQALEPAVRMLASEPGVHVAVFDEVADTAVWQELNIPGSPYAVVTSAAGDVLAKGTFNNYGQLLGMLAGSDRDLATANA